MRKKFILISGLLLLVTLALSIFFKPQLVCFFCCCPPADNDGLSGHASKKAHGEKNLPTVG